MKEWALKALIVVAGIFAPVKAMLVTVGVMIIADMITGIIAAIKRGEPVTSGQLKRTVVKCLIYETAIMLGFLTEHYLANDAVPISNIVASLVGMTELLSVLENLNDISGDGMLKPVIDRLTAINKKGNDSGSNSDEK